jgi:pectinesterase
MKRFFIIQFCLLAVVSVFGQGRRIVVAKDGSGNFKTVQDAFNSISLSNKKEVTIFVKSGIYKEKLRLDSSKSHVRLIGEDRFTTILSYDDHTGKISPRGDTINTYNSYSFLEAASDFSAENISFQNDAGFSAGQAVAVQILGDRAQFYNCRFLGNQDVLFPGKSNTRQFFQYCYIEGTTDFIFGPSIAWFEQCHIHCKKNSHITAASTPEGNKYGYIFHDCVLTGDTSLNKVSLGRPWRPFAKVVYLNCYIDRHIMPQGWSNWNNTENYKTVYYAEYKNYGPGAGTSARVDWSHQLNEVEAEQYNMTNVFGNWKPEVK